MRAIIGDQNAGYDIIDAIYTGNNEGYAIGKAENLYVVWYFRQNESQNDYYHGHYVMIDHDTPFRSRAKAFAHFYKRAAETLALIAKYGY